MNAVHDHITPGALVCVSVNHTTRSTSYDKIRGYPKETAAEILLKNEIAFVVAILSHIIPYAPGVYVELCTLNCKGQLRYSSVDWFRLP